MSPIGVVRTPHTDTKQIPKGPGAKHEAEGVIEIEPRFEAGLLDIEGFSHLFVLWAFDRSTDYELVGIPPVDTRPHGVFATRSPRRPNPIALTVVRLLRREGNRLYVAGVDMLDGSPVLDIKPYLSSVQAAELRRGWLDDIEPADAARELTVLMPCLNEAATVASCIGKARACIDRLGIVAEVVVADNGSTDGSQRLARDAGARVVEVPQRGYGSALYHGALAARGRFIIMGDADDSYDFSRLDAFIDRLREGADLVMGNRFLGGVRPGAMPWKNRYLGNPALTAIGRYFFHSAAGDFHCGLRGITRAAFDRLNLQTTGMEFASEMVIKATLLGLHVVEVPTTLDKDGRGRPPHLRPWRDGWRHLRFMLLYCPRWLFLYPGVAMMALGVTGSATLLAGAASRPGLLLVSSAATLLGFQSVAFAFCARIYAFNEGLLPEDKPLEALFGRFTLETGLLAGAALLGIGLTAGAIAVVGWSPSGVGTLTSREALQVAIPAVTAVCLGGQVVLTSFLFSFLGLRRR